MGAPFARAQLRPSSEAPALEWEIRWDVTHPERIRIILATAAALGSPALLRQGDTASPLRLETLEPEGGVLHWSGLTVDPGADAWEVEVFGHGCVYRMLLSGESEEPGTWVTPLPRQVLRLRRRAHRRAPAPEDLRMRLPLPGWLGRERQAVDMSASGLSLRMGAGERLPPGRVLQPIVLRTEGGEAMSLRGEVRHVSGRADGELQCGLHVTPLTAGDAERWQAMVARALHPATRTDGTRVEEHWRLFIDSGYFNLAGRSVEDFEARRRSFFELGRGAGTMGAVLTEVVWPSERGVEATLSAMKPYRSVWMVHQLARRQDAARFERLKGQMLRDVYAHCVEHAQRDPEFRWLASYIESTVPFTLRSHVGFADRMAATGRTLLLPMRMIDVECGHPSGQAPSGLELGPATEAERRLLVERIALTRPACYAEALDLRMESLDLRDATRAWQAVGLERERHLLVAREGAKPVAVAVLESGPPGTNPFGLLDSARLFALSPRARQAYPALMDGARRWFAQRGRDGFTFLAEEAGDVEAAGLHDAAPDMKPYLWLIPADLAPEFLEHIHEQTAPRPLSHPQKELS
ncbi:PilZ domain-containing protein [Corallococcus aberystwythensis]|uniref:PilZ domain-containing protein n=1 Tax=Corallococcus aberystwythensis TaxID=2316722 RepID=A0A3A8QK54_9BACT|nr:PilZ domain-containing protein [Corallococcus aberystwythensis]RKH69126.1 PilZ domain-containing protein [Corallococcus aberystwythensis]